MTKHHQLPSGQAEPTPHGNRDHRGNAGGLNKMAASATLHCLTG